MNNLIETLSTKYPEQWDEFVKWSIDNTLFEWDEALHPLSKSQERYLLADIQAWLDSEGTYADAFMDYNGRQFLAAISEKDAGNWDCISKHKTRMPALTAAVEKVMEIKQQKK